MKAFAIIQAQTFVPLLLPSICLFSFFFTYILFECIEGNKNEIMNEMFVYFFIYFFPLSIYFIYFFFIWNVKLSFKYYWHIYRWVEGEWKQNFLSQFDQLNMMEMRLDVCTYEFVMVNSDTYHKIVYDFSIYLLYVFDLITIINCLLDK